MFQGYDSNLYSLIISLKILLAKRHPLPNISFYPLISAFIKKLLKLHLSKKTINTIPLP